MKYAAILAGGVGKRMSSTLPKQFIELGGEPIIVRTIRKIVGSGLFDALVIAIHPDWREYLSGLIESAGVDTSSVYVTFGGKERLDSIANTIDYIGGKFGCGEKDDIVIFDAVRPFVSTRIMKDSLDALQHVQAVVAALPVVDTMLWIENGNLVKDMPTRQYLYHGQAPDSFKLVTLRDALQSLTEDEKKIITGTAQICMVKGIDIHTIPGDPQNIKITTPFDIQMGELICQSEQK